MKEIIAESLRCDPNFSDVKIEPIWKGAEANQRRRPDVRACWRGTLPVAFEVQLSTTFLRVIAERRQFYLSEGGLLFWVFQRFDLGDARLTQEDIFYNNNRNAFVASTDTLEASKKSNALVLDWLTQGGNHFDARCH
jgi:competence CoiA-like predicted nuclease